MSKTITIKAPANLHAPLNAALMLHSMDAAYDIEDSKTEDIISCSQGNHNKDFQAPMRIGALLDYINRLSFENKEIKIINFGKTSLDTHSNVFTNESGKKVNLTEKEGNLLIFLHKNKGSTITRDNILKEIWNYADDVETHTLETHIYRLRKKIEENPSKPKILLTADNGYTVI